MPPPSTPRYPRPAPTGNPGCRTSESQRSRHARAARAEPIRDRHEVGLEDRFQNHLQRSLNDPVGDRRDGVFILPLLQSGFGVVERGEWSW